MKTPKEITEELIQMLDFVICNYPVDERLIVKFDNLKFDWFAQQVNEK